MAWRAARSLLVWHAQLKAGAPGAKPPATDPDSWGLRAGGSHAQSGGHFPHPVPGLGPEIVTAADFPNAPALGLDAHKVLDDVRRSKDPRVLYAISNDEMFSSYAAHGVPAWTWRPYNPTDPGRDRHREHGHLQVVDDARADDARPWQTIGAAAPTPTEDDMQLSDVVKIPNYDGDPGLPAVESTNVGVALGVASQRSWQAMRNTKLILDLVKAVAAKVDIDPAELAAIEDAARTGAAEAFAEQRTQLVSDIIAALPQDKDGNLSAADVETALRAVFADAGA